MIRGKTMLRHGLMAGLFILVMVLVALPAALARVTSGSSLQLVDDETDHLTIKVYLPDQQTVQEIPLGDYLIGVVAAEMPSDFDDEALKAQFVVARTYAVRRMQQFGARGGCAPEPRADICADPRTGQAYISQEQYGAKHGAANASALWNRLGRLQGETSGQVLRYEGRLIDPLYHSVSGVRTENSGDYFTEQLPYLRAVDDRWGADSPKFKATLTRTPEQVAGALDKAGKPVTVPALSSTVKSGKVPFAVVEKTETGRVKTVQVLGMTLSGREVREALDLPSNNFTVSIRGGQIVFETIGNGHGVGMSQYGADGMARAGKAYREILLHYYPGVELAAIFDE